MCCVLCFALCCLALGWVMTCCVCVSVLIHRLASVEQVWQEASSAGSGPPYFVPVNNQSRPKDVPTLQVSTPLVIPRSLSSLSASLHLRTCSSVSIRVVRVQAPSSMDVTSTICRPSKEQNATSCTATENLMAEDIKV